MDNNKLTLKEFFQKAKEENKDLKVRFNKITDKGERTVVFSNAADVNAVFNDSKKVSPKILKTIEKNHDRVYKQNVEYTGSLVTFPEKITENTTHISDEKYIKTASDGSKWQWRRLYIEQIEDVTFDGTVVWKNDGLFDFNLVGKDGEETVVVSAEEYNKLRDEIERAKVAKVKDQAMTKAVRKQAVELAKSLGLEDVNHDMGCMNGWNYTDKKECLARMAINIKHDQLQRTNPEEHKMSESQPWGNRSGMHYVKCTCGYGYSFDTSD